MVDNLKVYIQNREYNKGIELVKENIKQYVISILKKQNPQFKYTNLMELDKECEENFKDANIIKKVFYIEKDIYLDDVEELENLMEIYKDLVKLY